MVDLETYETERKQAVKEQDADEERETILLPYSDSSEHSSTGTENIALIPPQDTEKGEEQLPEDPHTTTT